MKRIMILALAILFVLPVLPAFAEGTEISLTDEAVIDVSEAAEFTLTTDANFEYADIYADNTLLCTVEGDGSQEYAVSADFSKLHFLGSTTVLVKAYYATYVDTAKKNVKLIKYNPEVLKYEENFNEIKEGGTASIGSNLQGKATIKTFDRNETDKAVSLEMTNKVVTSNPYLIKDGIGIQPGAQVTLLFDAYIGADSRLALEMRDQNTGNTRYPTNNGTNMASFMFMNGGKFCEGSNTFEHDSWYNIKITINTASTGMDIYAKPESGDVYEMVASYPLFKCIGFNQIRFTVGATTDAGGVVAIDNIKVYDLSPNSDWYAKEKFEDGKLKIAFSKAMPQDKLYVTVYNGADEEVKHQGSYDAETNVYTCNFENPLNYGADYRINMSVVPTKNDKGELVPSKEALISDDGSRRYSESDIIAQNERYSTPVTFIKDNGSSISLNVDGSFSNGEMLMACRYEGNKLVSANYIKGEIDMPEYSVSLPAGEGESTVMVYILDSNLSVLDVYSK